MKTLYQMEYLKCQWNIFNHDMQEGQYLIAWGKVGGGGLMEDLRYLLQSEIKSVAMKFHVLT
jgi:hypothetical protein